MKDELKTTDKPVENSTLDLAQWQRIEVACERFEVDLANGCESQLEVYLQGFHGAEKEELVRELIGLDLEIRRRRGETPARKDYARFDIDTVEAIFASTNTECIATSGKHRSEDSELQLNGYSIVKKIGEGGMGAVFLAQQQQPITRNVAIKIIRSHLASDEVVRRFERERRAVAVMDHPGIAKVFEAGETAAGTPYLAMEFVEGFNLTEFCRINRPGIQERLRLLIKICEAVQHAHQKGILHRDLKPNNIIVCDIDGQAIPKIIDFGLAKSLQPNTSWTTDQTSIGTVMGTFQYMAPELAQHVQQTSVDTRSDIFSLGALLFELLTGSPPISEKSLAGASLFLILQMVREHIPDPPSTKLNEDWVNLPPNQTLSAWKKKIRGDLDWIALKALSNRKEDRYESAAALADDLRRVLSDEIVLARRPTFTYQARKFIKRNRIATITFSLIFIGLIFSLSVSWLAFFQIKKQRDKALESDRQAKIANQSLEVSNRSLASQKEKLSLQLKKTLRARKDSAAVGVYFTEVLNAVAVDRLGQEATVLDALEYTWKTFEARFPLDTPAKISVMEALSRTYLEIGEYRKAGTLSGKVLSHFETNFGDRHELTLSALFTNAKILLRLHRYQEAVNAFRELHRRSTRAYGKGQQKTVVARSSYGMSLAKAGEYEAAREQLRLAVKEKKRLFGENSTEVILNELSLAWVESKLGEHEKALEKANHIFEYYQRKLGKRHLKTMAVAPYFCDVLAQNAPQQAILKEAEIVRQFSHTFGENHPITIELKQRHAERLASANQIESAIEQFMDVHRWNLKHSARTGVYFRAGNHLVALLCDQNRSLEAREISLQLASEKLAKNGISSKFDRSLNLLRVELSDAKYEAANRQLEQLRADLIRNKNTDVKATADLLEAELLMAQEQFLKARIRLIEAKRIYDSSKTAFPRSKFVFPLDRQKAKHLLRKLSQVQQTDIE